MIQSGAPLVKFATLTTTTTVFCGRARGAVGYDSVKSSKFIGSSLGEIQFASAAMCARWIPLLASNPVTAGFFEILQHITNPALKTHGRIQVDGGSLAQCFRFAVGRHHVLSVGQAPSMRELQRLVLAQPSSCPSPVPAITQPSTTISYAAHGCTRPGDCSVYTRQLNNPKSTKSRAPLQACGIALIT